MPSKSGSGRLYGLHSDANERAALRRGRKIEIGFGSDATSDYSDEAV